MASNRKAVPRAIRDQVLGEYNYLCAICGGPSPQLHHIDGDNSNHDILNLLPLCPNHHLNDQHNPTHMIDRGRLVLFRRFKDPAILSPQFEPLYRRLRFMYDLAAESTDLDTLRGRASELIAFVAALHMGDFYAARLGRLIAPIDHAQVFTADTQPELDQRHRERHVEYVEKLGAGHEEVLRLCVELLRYQEWLPAKSI